MEYKYMIVKGKYLLPKNEIQVIGYYGTLIEAEKKCFGLWREEEKVMHSEWNRGNYLYDWYFHRVLEL